MGAVIDCKQQLVQDWTPSAGELEIQGERSQRGPILCSAARAVCFFQQGCSGYVTYVMDTRDKGTTIVDNVPIVRNYPDVFPKDFPGVPSERQFEFIIDMVLGAVPITKAPYRLASLEMQELSTQLQELLDKGLFDRVKHHGEL